MAKAIGRQGGRYLAAGSSAWAKHFLVARRDVEQFRIHIFLLRRKHGRDDLFPAHVDLRLHRHPGKILDIRQEPLAHSGDGHGLESVEIREHALIVRKVVCDPIGHRHRTHTHGENLALVLADLFFLPVGCSFAGSGLSDIAAIDPSSTSSVPAGFQIRAAGMHERDRCPRRPVRDHAHTGFEFGARFVALYLDRLLPVVPPLDLLHDHRSA